MNNSSLEKRIEESAFHIIKENDAEMNELYKEAKKITDELKNLKGEEKREFKEKNKVAFLKILGDYYKLSKKINEFEEVRKAIGISREENPSGEESIEQILETTLPSPTQHEESKQQETSKYLIKDDEQKAMLYVAALLKKKGEKKKVIKILGLTHSSFHHYLTHLTKPPKEVVATINKYGEEHIGQEKHNT